MRAETDCPPRHPMCRCIPRMVWDGPVYDWKPTTLSSDDEAFQAHLDEARQAILNAFKIPPQQIGVFKEQAMYYPEDYYEISERLRAGDEKPMVHIDIKDIRALPYALRRLAEQGHDMTLSLEALQKACDEQRKRKALEAAISDLTKPAEK